MKGRHIIILLLLSSGSFAQVRDERPKRAVESGFGVSGHGMLFYGGYVARLPKSLYFKPSLFFERGEQLDIRYQSLGVDAAFGRTLAKIDRRVFLNAFGGVTASSDSRLSDNLAANFAIPTTFKMGFFAGLEVEAFINDRFVVVMNWNQRMLMREAFGNYRWFGTVGVRYNF